MNPPRGAPSALPDGVLVVDKPAGISSFDVIRRLKPLLRRRKAGFVGTLDPFATGVLPLCIGEATKLADALSEGGKGYVATLRLGRATDSGDVSGTVVREAPVPLVAASELARVAGMFLGEIEQVPPMFSAVHVNGERLYEKARRGETVDRPSRRVTIEALTLGPMSETDIGIEVRCSRGTYVRVLGEDIARALGTEGHLTALRRTHAGEFAIAVAGTLDAILSEPQAAFPCFGVGLDALRLVGWSRLDLLPGGAGSVKHGGPILKRDILAHASGYAPGQPVSLYFERRLVALGVGVDEGDIAARPTRVLVRADAAP